MQIHTSDTAKNTTHALYVRSYGMVVACVLLASSLIAPFASAATPSSWSPTLLVNTEAFQVIDDRDSSANIVLRFGQTLEKTLTYDRGSGVFRFNDDVYVQGTLSGAIVHAGSQLRSSGTLITESGAYFDGTTMVVNANNNRVGFGTATPRGVFLHVGSSGTSADSNAAVYVNDGGTSSTFFQIRTASNRGDNFAVTNAGNVGVQTTTPGSQFSVSGAVIINPRGNLGSGAADAGVGLEVIGTVSGSTIFANQSLRSSGSLVFEGAASGSSLFLGTSLKGAGLTDCDTANQTLQWDATTGRFSCTSISAGSSFGSGNVVALGDSRYVNVSGDTMTGALSINHSVAQTTGLKMIGSGAYTLAAFSGGSIIHEARGNPNQVGTLSTSVAQKVFVAGRYAYIADNFSGLRIVDISNPASPALLGTYNTSGTAYDVVVVGRFAYVADDSAGLRIIDISDPASPILVGTYNTSGFATGIAVVGKYAYVADYSSGLQIIDISNPGSPILVGTYNTSGNANDVAVVGRYAYVADGSAGLHVIDVTNPAAPMIVGTYDTTGNAYGLSIVGRYAYVADGTSGIHIIDISTPSSPSLMGTYDTLTANGIDVAGRYAYVADDVLGIHIIDVSSPAAPVLVGSYNTSGAAQGIAIAGGYAYVAGNTSGLQVININGLETPTASIGAIETDSLNVLSDSTFAGNVSVNSMLNVGNGLQVFGQTAMHAFSGAALTLSSSGSAKTPFLLNVRGLGSGKTLYATDSLRSSGSLVFEGAASGSSLFLGTSLMGAGLTDCDTGATSKLLWDSTTGRFSCGTDQTGGGSSFGSGNVLTIGDGRYVNVSGDTMTGGLTIQNGNTHSPTATPLLNVRGTVSGALLFGQQLRSSGSLIVEFAGFFGSGIVISRPEDTASLTLKDTTNNDDVTIRTGSGSPNGVVSAQLGSLFVDHFTGKLYKNNNGSTQWVEVGTGSGTVHMAKMRRNAAQSTNSAANTKILLDTEEFDVGDIADAATNNRFNIRKTGKYLITGVSCVTAGVNNTQVQIWKNGVIVSRKIEGQTASSEYCAEHTAVLDLIAGDYIEMYMFTGAARTTATDIADSPRMSVVQLDGVAGNSGSPWTSSGTLSYLTDTTDNVSVGALAADTKLEVIGTVSGSTIFANQSLRSSGSLVFEGAASGSSLFLGTSLMGAGLTDCDTGATSKLLWDSTTGRFSCGTDQTGGGSSFGSGNVLTISDGRYVNVSGDTMTGGLTIQNGNTHSPTATPLLNVRGTVSGALLFGQQLRSSGSLIVEFAGFFGSGIVISRPEDTASLTLKDTTNNDDVTIRTGSGSPNGVVSAQLGSLFVDHFTGKLYKNNNGSTQWVEVGTGSGTVHMAKMTRVAAQSIPDASLTKIAFDTENFDVGDIADSVTNDRFTIRKAGKYLVTTFWSPVDDTTAHAEIVYVYKNGSVVAEMVLRSCASCNRLSPTLTEVIDAVPGDYLEMYVFQNAGNALDTAANVANYPRMSVVQLDGVAGNSGSPWTSSGTLSYLTDTTDNVSVGALAADTKLEVIGTVSGSTIFANQSLRSSGSLVFEGAASGSSLFLGTSLKGAGLTDCDTGATSKLLWDSTTGRFSCGTDQTGGGSSFGSGNVLTIGDGRYVNVSGDTMTGALTINHSTSQATGLKMIGSGAYTLAAFSGGSIIHEARGNPRLVGTYNTSSYSYKTFVAGRYAYVADYVAGLHIIDVSTPASPALLASVATTAAQDVVVAGRYAYVADGTSGLRIIDVSNPSSPKLIGTYATSGQSYGVAVAGRYAYVADYSSGLQIIDIANPATPALVGTYNTSGFAQAVTVIGRYAYVADGGAGVQIIDISNPSSPILVGNYNTSGYAYHIKVVGRYAYVADSTAGVQIVDIGNPASPSLVSTYNTSGGASGIDIAGRYAYVADYDYGVHVLDISVPASPNLVGSYNTSGNAWGVTVAGKYAYVADEASGLHIIDINGFETPAASIGALETNSLNVLSDSTFAGNVSVNSMLNVGNGLQVFGQTAMQAFSGAALTLSSSGSAKTPFLLNVRGLGSGKTLYATDSLRSSGSLVFEGAASGSSLFLGTSLKGAGLTDCDTGATSKLLWDSTTGRFSCGTDQTGGGGSSFNISDGSTSEQVDNADTITFVDGTDINVTVSPTDTVTVNFTNASGYLTSESDPTYYSNPSGYLTSYSETDPTYYSNPSGYLTSYSETDPAYYSNPNGYVTSGSVPTYETDPEYSANAYANAMNQYVGNSDSPSFSNLTVTSSLTLSSAGQGGVIFANASYQMSQDNSMFVWDDTSDRLGIGTSNPDRRLEVLDSSGDPQMRLTYSDSSSYVDLGVDSSGNFTISPTGSSTAPFMKFPGMISGSTLYANQSLRSSGSLVVEGNLVFGDAIGDAITVNAGAWTFLDGTVFTVGGGAGTLEVVGTLSGSSIVGRNLNSSTSAATGSVLVSRTGGAPEWKAPTGAMTWYLDGTVSTGVSQGAVVIMPFGMTVTDVDLKAKGIPTGSALIVDINENGTTIFSTRPEIDAGQSREDGNHVISDTNIAEGSEVTVDVDQVGSTFAGSGVTVMLKGTRKY